MANSYLIWCVKSLQRYAVLDTAIDSISTDNGARPLVEAIRCFRALQIGAWNGLSFRLNVCTYICIYIYIYVCIYADVLTRARPRVYTWVAHSCLHTCAVGPYSSGSLSISHERYKCSHNANGINTRTYPSYVGTSEERGREREGAFAKVYGPIQTESLFRRSHFFKGEHFLV